MQRLMILAAVVAWAPALHAGDAPGIKQTIAYVQKLQGSDGGFFPTAPQPAALIRTTMKSTSAAVRALHYLGGDVPDKDAAKRFVESCWDNASGGFADLPGGKADIFTTAVGLMAVTELKMPTEKYAAAAVKYVSDSARTFEDIRIAVAGLERLEVKSPRAKEWLDEVRKLQNADGSFGKGPGKARATGGSIVTVLRLGGEVGDREAILKVIKAGQRNNGGYGKEDNEIASDLETTYRVMRCFVMLKARPDKVEGVRSYVAKCRNADGGFGIAPGEASNVNATYFAAIIRYWLDKKE